MGHSHSVVRGLRALAGWAGVGVVLMMLGNPTWAAEKKKEPKTETRIREINVYSGTIKAIDPKNYTLTVDGQIQTITEEIEIKQEPKKKKGVISTKKSKPKTGSSAKTAPAKPASGPRTFLILGGSMISKSGSRWK
jgi:hypothetical protein